MPQRVGYLWEKMIDLENCINAEIIMGKNKKKRNKLAKYIAEHPEKYAKTLQVKLSSGTFTFHPYKEAYIKDSYKGKTRHLKIPCLEDQAAMQAWLNIATPYIERRNYYYNCGSIPGAGQKRAIKGLQKWLRERKPPKYAAITDIQKFYDTCPHGLVMDGLRNIFKDEMFLHFAEMILEAMSDNGIGLAIGFPVSHWFANVALMELDHEIKRKFPKVKMTRYMDDIAMVSHRKRTLHKAVKLISSRLQEAGMRIKRTWQVFQVKQRGVTFLSYRFFHRNTLLTKKLMYRIARKAKKPLTERTARCMTSYKGILQRANCHKFYEHHIEPRIQFKRCRRVISNEDKLRYAA